LNTRLTPATHGMIPPRPRRERHVLDQYGPVFIFAALAAVFPLATLWFLKFIRPTPPPSEEKLMPYECGITPESDSRGRYTVRYYLIAILFVIFDVETIYLFPWAVQYH